MRSPDWLLAFVAVSVSWRLLPAVDCATKLLQITLRSESDDVARLMTINGQPVFSFSKAPNVQQAARLMNASLQFEIDAHYPKSSGPISICLFELKNHYQLPGSKANEIVLLKTIHVERDQQQGVIVDITDRVTLWLREKKKLRLVLDCVGCDRFLVKAATGPTIALKLEKASRFRAIGRSQSSCTNGDGCCIEKFYVDFRLLGWDSWIISPIRYNANYCKGNCDNVRRTPDTFNTFYSYIMDSHRRKANVDGRVCCVPTRFRPMSLLFYDNRGQIVKSDAPNMIVDECGCV